MLAIPHNGNLSNGLMFDDVTLTTKKPLDRDYAERRMRWEPIYEITQMKGDGETHPALSPQRRVRQLRTLGQRQLRPGAQDARHAAARVRPRGVQARPGLRGQARRQPVQVRHDRLDRLAHRPVDHHGGQLLRQGGRAGTLRRPDPLRRSDRRPGAGRPRAQQSAPCTRDQRVGLAAVWARDNTREALWDAMARKEVYATTGTRLHGARLRRLRLHGQGSGALRLRRARLRSAACRWAAT